MALVARALVFNFIPRINQDHVDAIPDDRLCHPVQQPVDVMFPVYVFVVWGDKDKMLFKELPRPFYLVWFRLIDMAT